MLRPGFVEEWNSLDSLAAKFAKVLLSKENATPSASYKLFTTYDPEAVLWLGFTSKDAAVKDRFHQFLKVWPEAKTRIPHALMQEMRITPELPGYADLIHSIFLQLIDGKLVTPEEARAFLEPHSPPAPPPQITIKRTRAKRGAEPKVKERSFDDDEEGDDDLEDDDEIEDIVVEDEEIDLGLAIPKSDLDEEADSEEEGEDEIDEDDDEPPTPPKGKKGAKPGPEPVPVGGKSTSGAGAKTASKTAPVTAGKSGPAATAKSETKSVPAPKVPPAPAPKAPPVKARPNPVKPAKAAPPKPVAKAVAKASAKSPAKPAKPAAKPKAQAKVPTKAPAKTATKKPVPSKPKIVSKPAKPAKPVKKPAAKPAKKR
jgi:hypothetical protein